MFKLCVWVLICSVVVQAELVDKASSKQVNILLDSEEVFTASSQIENDQGTGVMVTISSQDHARIPSVRSERHVVTVRFGGKTVTFYVNFDGNEMHYSRTVDSPITMHSKHIEDLQTMRQYFEDFTTGKSSASHKYLGLAEKLLSWLSDAQPGYVIDSFQRQPTVLINVNPTLNVSETESNELRGVRCTGVQEVVSNEVSCPVTSTVKEANEGVTCLCPYSGTTPRNANYDSGSSSTAYSWRRPYGSATSTCLGRCGKGCSDSDKQAYKDCFDHDSCIDHFGGSSMSGNPNCADEFFNADEDYAASFITLCCK